MKKNENKKVNPYVSMVCQKGNTVSLCSSPAGYYLGTYDEDGPCCRLSSCVSEKDVPALIPNRICEENLFCNGGQGCILRKADGGEERHVRFVHVREVSEAVFAVLSGSDAEACALVEDALGDDIIRIEPGDFCGYEIKPVNTEPSLNDEVAVQLKKALFDADGNMIHRDTTVFDWLRTNFGISLDLDLDI